jgi:competence protein ComEC
MPDFKGLPRDELIAGVRIQILYPPANFQHLARTQKWRNVNNNSLVVKASYGSVSILFPGDIMAAAERELARMAGDHLASTVVMAPHHGSRTSSTALFLRRVRPEVVIVSARRRGRGWFPHPVVLERYRRAGSRVYQTDRDGAVMCRTDGDVLNVVPFIQDRRSPGRLMLAFN